MHAAVVRQMWERIEDRDWSGVGELLHVNVVIDWPHSGERIRGRENFVSIQREYPGTWHLTVLSVSAGPECVAAQVRVDHEAEVCFGSGFYQVENGQVVSGTEYWTTARSQDPVSGRAQWTEPMDS